MRILSFILFSLVGIAEVAAQDCPSGPFQCVPWAGGTGNPPAPPPPPPFILVDPLYIKPERFDGFIGIGEGTRLSILKGPIPENAMKLIKPFQGSLDGTKIYVLPTNGGEASKYIMFKGSNIQ